MNIAVTVGLPASSAAARWSSFRPAVTLPGPFLFRFRPRPDQLAGLRGRDSSGRSARGAAMERLGKETVSSIGRVEGTRALVAAMRERPPNVLVSASGIGYYGSLRRSDSDRTIAGRARIFWVRWQRHGNGKLGKPKSWGVRVVPLRIGTVMGGGRRSAGQNAAPFPHGRGRKARRGQPMDALDSCRRFVRDVPVRHARIDIQRGVERGVTESGNECRFPRAPWGTRSIGRP